MGERKLKVAVLGSGVIGVTAAYYLSMAGCEVTVVDRQPHPGLETSFANAGEISPGYATPWAGPGVPMKAIRWLLQKHGPLAIRPLAAGPRAVPWLGQLLSNCTRERYRRNKAQMLVIAEYSRDCLRDLRAATGVRYDERSLGTLQVFRTEQQVTRAQEDARALDEIGVPYAILDAEGCRRAEPGLSRSLVPIAGGMQLPGDETGDCLKFTQGIAHVAGLRGVEFAMSTTARSLETDAGRILSVRTDRGSIVADLFVIALGSYSPMLLDPVGIRLPVYPIKGYSLTAAVSDGDSAPVSTVMDETFKVAITRLGDRVRIGGTAEIAGYCARLRDRPLGTLRKSVSELFPRGCDLEFATPWTGLRAMTPTGVPAVGPTRIPNLFVSTGHGTLGWTMACGSASLLADLVLGRRPAIDPEPYDPRYW